MTVSGHGIREGLFYEHFLPEDHPPLFPDIRRASIENLARMHDQHTAHALHVRHLSLQLFDQLREVHGLGAAERELLAAAALVHDIGMAIDYYEHHEHSAYLILNADLQGTPTGKWCCWRRWPAITGAVSPKPVITPPFCCPAMKRAWLC